MTVGLATEAVLVREWVGGVGGKTVGELGGVQVDEMLEDPVQKHIASSQHYLPQNYMHSN